MPVHRVPDARLHAVIETIERNGELVVTAYPDPMAPGSHVIYTQKRTDLPELRARVYERMGGGGGGNYFVGEHGPERGGAA